jgi:hypothetical protein
VPRDRSGGHNLRKLASSLNRRQQRARQIHGQGGADWEELWRVWKDASELRGTAGEFWPAGRDAALALLAGERREGLARLREVLATLSAFGFRDAAASCLRRAAEALTDQELLDQFGQLGPGSATMHLLPEDIRRRAVDAARRIYSAQPTTESARLLGRLLVSESEAGVGNVAAEGMPPSESGLEARALHFARSHGTETVAGIRYEAQYALWRMLTDEDIDCLGLQNLEDIKVAHLSQDGSRVIEHVQAKKRDSDWSIPNLQGRGEEANRVFDSFAEVALADRDARLTFATDARLARGLAKNLLQAAKKFRDIAPDPAQLKAVTLAGVELTTDERRALDQVKAGMRPDLLDRVDLPLLLARVTFDTGRTRRELHSELIRRISARLGVADPAAQDAYHAFIGLLLEQMEERGEFRREEIEALIEQAGVRARAFRELAASSARLHTPRPGVGRALLPGMVLVAGRHRSRLRRAQARHAGRHASGAYRSAMLHRSGTLGPREDHAPISTRLRVGRRLAAHSGPWARSGGRDRNWSPH